MNPENDNLPWEQIFDEFRDAIVESLAHDHSPLTFGENADDLEIMERAVLYRAVALMPTQQFRRALLEDSPLLDRWSNESLYLAFDDEAEIEQCLAEHIARNNAD